MPTAPRISDREAEVHAALASGQSNAQIASRLCLSVRTVEGYVSSLLRKYGVPDRRALAALAPAGEPGAGPSGIPPSLTSFVGRTAELTTILEMIRNGVRLITLTGPGGAGKSRLAATAVTAAARSFPLGAAFIDLLPVRPEAVPETVAAGLGATEPPEQPLTDALAETLGTGRRLLALDNCEHLIEPVTTLIGSLLARCPGTVVLVTSRERLAMPGEHCVLVGPLPTETDAVRLFTDRATEADPAFTADDPAAIQTICAGLDGMPLAIELAAARSAALGTAGLLAAWRDSLRLLAGGRSADERHRSVRAVIDWSYQLLGPAERALLDQLSVFAGTFDLDAVCAVIGADIAAAADVLGRLTDKSLVMRERQRWRLLQTVRVFAAERLEEGTAAAQTRCGHLTWAAGLAAGLRDRLPSDGWRADFDAVADDLRQALASTPAAPDPVAHDLAATLAALCFARGFLSEALATYRQAVPRAPDDRTAAADLAHGAAVQLISAPSSPLVIDLLREAALRARTAGDPRMTAIYACQAYVMSTRHRLGLQVPVPAALTELLAGAERAIDATDPLMSAHLAAARLWRERGSGAYPDPDLAAAAVTAARAAADPALISGALEALALTAWQAGRYGDAHQLTRERLALLPDLPRSDPRAAREVIDALQLAVHYAICVGDPREALDVARQYEDEDMRGHTPVPAVMRIVPLVLLGELRAAIRLSEQVWESASADDSRMNYAMIMRILAASLACGLLGDAAGCAHWQRQLIRRTQRTAGAGFHPDGTFAAFTGARIAIASGERQDAARLVRRAFDGTGMGYHRVYAHSAGAELAVIAALPQAGELLARLAVDAEQSEWARAVHLRASGRLNGDIDLLRASCEGWERIGARYERASTLLLIPGREAEGQAELRAIGVIRAQ